MPTIRRPRLLKADVLRGMKPSNIVALLTPYADYFRRRGIELAPLERPGSDFTDLATVLACPVEQTPPKLVEQLEVLDVISDSQSTLNFENEYQDLVARLVEDGDTAADIAVKLLLNAPEVACREFDRQALQVQRSLVSFRVREEFPFLGIDESRVERFRSLVIPWFKKSLRSDICYVHHAAEPEGVGFVIRHGDLLKRIGVLDEHGDQRSYILRPERLDIAHFNRMTGEWQVSGLGTKLQDLYREAFGAAFHGSTKALVHSQRYSLEPLREGPSCLACDPRASVQFAELKSLRIELPSGGIVVVSRCGVFETLAENPDWLATGTLLEALISLKLANRRRRVPLRICPERDTIHGNAAAPAIDAWLNERGFANDDGRLLASA